MARDTADVRLNFLAVGADKIKALFSQIDTQRKALNNSPVSIKIGADDESANEKINEVFRQLEALNHSRANISMAFPDYASARAKLDELKNMTSALNGKVIRESIKIDGLGKATLDFAALAKLQNDQSGKKTDFSGGSGSGGGSAGGILGALPAAQGLLNPYTIAAGLAALPFAAQAAAGGITLAFGGAFAALAAVGASKAKSVQDSFATLKTDASNDLTAIGKPFVSVMNSILTTARTTMNKLTPLFTSVISGISKPFQSFSDTFIATLGGPNVRNALTSLGTAFGSVLTALTPQLPGDINAIADGFKRIGEAVSKNPKAIADFASALFRIAGFALDAIAGLTNVATYVEQHFVPAFDRARHDIAGWWDGLINDLTGTWDTYWNNTIGRTIRGGHDIEAAFNTTFSWISNAWDTLWNTLSKNFLIFIRDGVLTPLGWIIDGAARAFGWIPGIGGQLKNAAKAFDQFRVNVNNAIGGINGKTISVNVDMATGTAVGSGGGHRLVAASGLFINRGTTPTADDVLVRASKGELIVPANMVNAGYVDHLRGRIPGFAGGGIAGGINVSESMPGQKAMAASILGTVTKLANTFAQGIFSAIPVSSVGAGVMRWAPLVLQALSMEHLGAFLASQVLYQMNTESGGNPNAINLTDSNAAAGDPSRGLLQTIGSTFSAYHWPGTSWNIFDPLANIAAAINYARHVYGPNLMSGGMGMGSGHGYRYGGLVSFDKGGWLTPGYTLAYNGTGAAERVTPPGRGAGNTYQITINPTPLAHPRDIGREVVGAIREFEKGAGKGWRN